MLHREIHPEYETVGKRRRMVGVRAQILDDTTVVYDRSHANYSEAEHACDAYVYDLLSADPPSPEPPIVIVEAPDETPPESRYTLDAIRDALECVENEQCDQDFAQPQPDEDAPTPLESRFTREPQADNSRHGHAWRGPFGLLRWCEPGYDPNSELLRVSV